MFTMTSEEIQETKAFTRLRNAKGRKHVENNKKPNEDHKLSPESTKSRRLFTWEEMPVHLQFNKYIRTGYRKLTNVKGCAQSLLFLHNETGNIFTHVPMAIYTLVYWYSFWPWEKLSGKIYLYGIGICHTIAMVVPWFPSFFYHTLMCHEGGPKVYHGLLKVDVLGIWMTECFGSITNLSATTWFLHDGLQGALMALFQVIAVYGLVKSFKAQTPKERVSCFAPLLIFRILSFALRLSPWGGGDPDVLHHVILQDVTSIVGGIIGVARIPEKWFIGKCDFWLNSHNIMHLFVILAVYHMNQAANGDVQWILNQTKAKNYFYF